MSTAGHPRFVTRGARVTAKADLLLETARQYAHGAVNAQSVLLDAIAYAEAVMESKEKPCGH